VSGEYQLDFSFSDLVAGYLTAYDPGQRRLDLRTSDGRTIPATCAPALHAELVRNLGAPAVPVTERLDELLVPGMYLFAYGIYNRRDTGHAFETYRLILLGREAGEYAFESSDWWPRQLVELARFYRRAQFGQASIPDFVDYRTILRLDGGKGNDYHQETDAISRLVYGMSSAYLLTGDEDFLTVAERGAAYVREHMRFVDRDNDVVYWYHGIDVRDGKESKLFTSEFSDDHLAIPAYEQIYALTGLTQTYRVTGDPDLLADIQATLRLFEKFFRDPEHGGYYSHLDPIHLSPYHASLGRNRSRKNWNSIGDHAPAYLINLFLATGDTYHADLLEHTFDLIAEHFPHPDSPFVQERFHQDWRADRSWGWQQDRAVVGHNLKIAWNMMRMNAIRPKTAYRDLAERIARGMPSIGSDTQRGGWYDVVERVADPDSGSHRFAWLDRKAWWQQEQAVLAYLILAGNTGGEEYLRQARQAAAFYNAFFLDHDEGGVYFNVLADGLPYLLGTERLKGSHSMSMYHAAELCYLATIYQRLLIHRQPLDLWFRPNPGGFPGRVLRVAPDALPPGRVRLERVHIDGKPHRDFDADNMTVALPDAGTHISVRVRMSAVD
jgi:mannose/cellobiose epimerase-like protein (N-acyl-D-glucosamine 2-epimerase family)